jgi:hypothetical protein
MNAVLYRTINLFWNAFHFNENFTLTLRSIQSCSVFIFYFLTRRHIFSVTRFSASKNAIYLSKQATANFATRWAFQNFFKKATNTVETDLSVYKATYSLFFEK